LTGLDVSFTSIMLDLSGGQLSFLLVLTMISCIVFRIVLPTSAAYIMSATIPSSVLLVSGIVVLLAIFFVFCFATLSTLTPPVALASYAASGIANASSSKVGWAAFRLAIAWFIIPFAFVYEPSLLLIDSNVWDILNSVITALLGVYIIAAAV